MNKIVIWLGSIVAIFTAGWLSAFLGWLIPPGQTLYEDTLGRGEECFRVEAIHDENRYPHKFCFDLNAPNCGLKHQNLGGDDANVLRAITCEEEFVEVLTFFDNGEISPPSYWSINEFRIIRSDRNELEGRWRDSNKNSGKIVGEKI